MDSTASLHFGVQVDRYLSGNLREVNFYTAQLARYTEGTHRPGG